MTRPVSPSTHLSLLAAFGSGDAAAWRRFFERYAPVVRQWCLRRGLRPEDADDLTQDLMIELREKLAKYDRFQRFRPWLKAVVNNFLATWWRERERRVGTEGTGRSEALRRLEDLAAAESVGEVLDSLHRSLADDGRRVAAAVRAKVSEETWQAFYLTVCEGRPGAEVARALGKTPGSVYQAAYRVGNMLREEARRLATPQSGENRE
jgi:RNA polymerase sigma-70 factor (ECF subfamily)